MKKFLVIFGMSREGLEKWRTTPEEEKQADGKLWMDWFEKNGNKFHDIGGGVGVNMRFNKDGMDKMPNEMCGYSILKAESFDEAKEILSTNPHFSDNNPTGYFDIMEVMD